MSASCIPNSSATRGSQLLAREIVDYNHASAEPLSENATFKLVEGCEHTYSPYNPLDMLSQQQQKQQSSEQQFHAILMQMLK